MNPQSRQGSADVRCNLSYCGSEQTAGDQQKSKRAGEDAVRPRSGQAGATEARHAVRWVTRASRGKLQFASICDGVADRTSAYNRTVLSQILINLAIGLHERGFVVWNVVRQAVGFDYFLNLAKFVCRHGRKQVMLDLAGEAAGAVVNSGTSLDVPAGEDLFTQEVYRGSTLEQRHALMIRREYERQIQSQEHLLHHEKQDGVPPTDKETEQAQKPTQMQNEETNLADGMGDFVAHQESDAVDFQDKCFQQRQWEETEMLVSHGKARKPAFSDRLILCECEQRYIDVGIAGNVVRRAMMRIVFV